METVEFSSLLASYSIYFLPTIFLSTFISNICLFCLYVCLFFSNAYSIIGRRAALCILHINRERDFFRCNRNYLVLVSRIITVSILYNLWWFSMKGNTCILSPLPYCLIFSEWILAVMGRDNLIEVVILLSGNIQVDCSFTQRVQSAL